MAAFPDNAWETMQGGYRLPFDPRPHLLRLKTEPTNDRLWSDLVGELYHQGDVGEASYASVPELAFLMPPGAPLPWQLVTLVVSIDLARTEGANPPLPSWLEPAYIAAIEALALRSLCLLAAPTQIEATRAMLALVALWKGYKVYATALLDHSEEELAPLLPH